LGELKTERAALEIEAPMLSAKVVPREPEITVALICFGILVSFLPKKMPCRKSGKTKWYGGAI
jgi:hypothetical protein